jgi:Spy/CpxP family protein refolding chaperone
MLRCSFLSGLAVALAATLAFAQPPAGGGFRGGGFGGMGMSPAMLLTIPEVQTEINVTEAQKPQLEELRGDVQKDMQAAMSGFDFQAMRDMSQEERTKKMAELRTKTQEVNKQTDAKLAKILDEKQMKRLKELELQRAGAAAFSRAEVLAKLGVSDAQKAEIKKIQDAARTQTRPAFNPDATAEERQAARAKMQESQAKLLKDIVAVLTEQQLATWKELTGKEFKFPQGRGAGGRRPQTNPN